MLLAIAAGAQILRLALKAYDLGRESLIGDAFDKAFPDHYLVIGDDGKVVGLVAEKSVARDVKQTYELCGIVPADVRLIPQGARLALVIAHYRRVGRVVQ